MASQTDVNNVRENDPSTSENIIHVVSSDAQNDQIVVQSEEISLPETNIVLESTPFHEDDTQNIRVKSFSVTKEIDFNDKDDHDEYRRSSSSSSPIKTNFKTELVLITSNSGDEMDKDEVDRRVNDNDRPFSISSYETSTNTDRKSSESNTTRLRFSDEIENENRIGGGKSTSIVRLSNGEQSMFDDEINRREKSPCSVRFSSEKDDEKTNNGEIGGMWREKTPSTVRLSSDDEVTVIIDSKKNTARNDNSHSADDEIQCSSNQSQLLIEVPSKDNWTRSVNGIDNPAFETDNHHLKINTNGTMPMKNGTYANNNGLCLNSNLNGNANTNHQKKVKSDDSDSRTTEEMAEAVNLELINMGAIANGLNGIPVKSPNSTVISMSNPYDEYFIPVNEHKKYMRGEKLYVTKDKRDINNSKKNCCVWIVGLIILAFAVLLAILIATKLNQEPMLPVSQDGRNLSDSYSLSADIGSGYIDGIQLSSPSPAPDIIINKPPPTTDMTPAYLKHALEGDLPITLKYIPELSDHSSTEFQETASQLEDELRKVLFEPATLNYGAADIYIKVINITPESVVHYRIGWVFKKGINKPPDPIDVFGATKRLEDHLRYNNGFLYSYKVPSHKIRIQNVIDECLFSNGNCSDFCSFSYNDTLDFQCSCPEGLYLDATGFNCEITDTADQNREIVSGNYNFGSNNQGEPEPASTSEPESQPQPASERESKSEPEPAQKSESESEILEPEPEPKSESELKLDDLEYNFGVKHNQTTVFQYQTTDTLILSHSFTQSHKVTESELEIPTTIKPTINTEIPAISVDSHRNTPKPESNTKVPLKPYKKDQDGRTDKSLKPTTEINGVNITVDNIPTISLEESNTDNKIGQYNKSIDAEQSFSSTEDDNKFSLDINIPNISMNDKPKLSQMDDTPHPELENTSEINDPLLQLNKTMDELKSVSKVTLQGNNNINLNASVKYPILDIDNTTTDNSNYDAGVNVELPPIIKTSVVMDRVTGNTFNSINSSVSNGGSNSTAEIKSESVSKIQLPQIDVRFGEQTNVPLKTINSSSVNDDNLSIRTDTQPLPKIEIPNVNADIRDEEKDPLKSIPSFDSTLSAGISDEINNPLKSDFDGNLNVSVDGESNLKMETPNVNADINVKVKDPKSIPSFDSNLDAGIKAQTLPKLDTPVIDAGITGKINNPLKSDFDGKLNVGVDGESNLKLETPNVNADINRKVKDPKSIPSFDSNLDPGIKAQPLPKLDTPVIDAGVSGEINNPLKSEIDGNFNVAVDGESNLKIETPDVNTDINGKVKDPFKSIPSFDGNLDPGIKAQPLPKLDTPVIDAGITGKINNPLKSDFDGNLNVGVDGESNLKLETPNVNADINGKVKDPFKSIPSFDGNLDAGIKAKPLPKLDTPVIDAVVSGEINNPLKSEIHGNFNVGVGSESPMEIAQSSISSNIDVQSNGTFKSIRPLNSANLNGDFNAAVKLPYDTVADVALNNEQESSKPVANLNTDLYTHLSNSLNAVNIRSMGDKNLDLNRNLNIDKEEIKLVRNTDINNFNKPFISDLQPANIAIIANDHGADQQDSEQNIPSFSIKNHDLNDKREDFMFPSRNSIHDILKLEPGNDSLLPKAEARIFTKNHDQRVEDEMEIKNSNFKRESDILKKRTIQLYSENKRSTPYNHQVKTDARKYNMSPLSKLVRVVHKTVSTNRLNSSNRSA